MCETHIDNDGALLVVVILAHVIWFSLLWM